MGTGWLDILILDPRRPAGHPASAASHCNCRRHRRATLAASRTVTVLRCHRHPRCYLPLMQVLIATEPTHSPAFTTAIAYWQPPVRTSTALFT